MTEQQRRLTSLQRYPSNKRVRFADSRSTSLCFVEEVTNQRFRTNSSSSSSPTYTTSSSTYSSIAGSNTGLQSSEEGDESNGNDNLYDESSGDPSETSGTVYSKYGMSGDQLTRIKTILPTSDGFGPPRLVKTIFKTDGSPTHGSRARIRQRHHAYSSK